MIGPSLIAQRFDWLRLFMSRAGCLAPGLTFHAESSKQCHGLLL
jgi:hypothetical protein